MITTSAITGTNLQAQPLLDNTLMQGTNSGVISENNNLTGHSCTCSFAESLATVMAQTFLKIAEWLTAKIGISKTEGGTPSINQDIYLKSSGTEESASGIKDILSNGISILGGVIGGKLGGLWGMAKSIGGKILSKAGDWFKKIF